VWKSGIRDIAGINDPSSSTRRRGNGRAQAEELAEQECKKRRLLTTRRWKMVG
jgi:hypothetical protein